MASGQSYMDYEIQSEVIGSDRPLTRGDQIAVDGNFNGIPYYHHGIYLGDCKVADFGGNDKSGTKPRIVSLIEFRESGKRTLYRINYRSGRCFSPDVAARNAKLIVENPDLWGKYNVLLNNCEHFATRCKTGVANSQQVLQHVNECIENPANVIHYIGALTNAGSKSAF